MASRIDDRNRLPAEMNNQLNVTLEPDERVLVTFKSTGGAGAAGTDRRVYLYKNKTLQAHRYEDLWGVEWGTGFLHWLQLRGPGLDDRKPSLGNLGDHPAAVQITGEKAEEREAFERLVRARARPYADNSPTAPQTFAARPRASAAAAPGSAAPGAAPVGLGPRGDQARASEMPGAEGIILEAEGAGGHLWLFEDRVRIKHFGMRGLMTKGFLKGDKEISLHQISAVQWRTPGKLWLGHIQFSFLGGSSDAREAAKDENAVMFYAAQEPAFRAIKEEIDNRLRALRHPPPVASPGSGGEDIPSRIRQLAELRDAGILSEAEFEAKKTELLSRM